MNLQMNYSFFDGSTRIYGAAIFSNPLNLAARDVEEILMEELLCGDSFIPTEWNVALSWDNLSIDLPLVAAFDGIEETNVEANSGSINNLPRFVKAVNRQAA